MAEPGPSARPTVRPTGQARVLLVVPTLGRRPELLRQTLDSLTAQHDEPADLVVVLPPDRSEARQAARSAGAQVLDDPGSLSAAVNLGWGQAREWHRYVNWIGDDDLLADGALEIAARALDADPGAVAAFGHCAYIDDAGRHLFTSRAGRIAPWLMTWGPDLVPQPGALFRLSAVQAAGGLDETLSYAMDLDLLLRLRRMGRLVNTGRLLASFRWHADSATVSNRSASLAEAETVKRRYLPPWARALTRLCEAPVRLATRLAVRRVNGRARRVAADPSVATDAAVSGPARGQLRGSTSE